MSKPFFLLTGDDSVRAEGLTLVRRIVEKIGDVAIIATRTQQSAAGGRMNFKGGAWGTEIVDGFETIWVDGSPVDSVHFAIDYLDRKPDFVISGMNKGDNVDTSILASGTVAAALRANVCMNIPSIAFSMEIPLIDNTWMNEQKSEFREELMNYPGNSIDMIVKKFIERSKTWNGVWNVNFPQKPTDKIKYCGIYSNVYYPNNIKIIADRFDYKMDIANVDAQDSESDVKAMLDGYISITPIKFDITDWEELEKLKQT